VVVVVTAAAPATAAAVVAVFVLAWLVFLFACFAKRVSQHSAQVEPWSFVGLSLLSFLGGWPFSSILFLFRCGVCTDGRDPSTTASSSGGSSSSSSSSSNSSSNNNNIAHAALDRPLAERDAAPSPLAAGERCSVADALRVALDASTAEDLHRPLRGQGSGCEWRKVS
jgi:hypothetical protein